MVNYNWSAFAALFIVPICLLSCVSIAGGPHMCGLDRVLNMEPTVYFSDHFTLLNVDSCSSYI